MNDLSIPLGRVNGDEIRLNTTVSLGDVDNSLAKAIALLLWFSTHTLITAPGVVGLRLRLSNSKHRKFIVSFSGSFFGRQ